MGLNNKEIRLIIIEDEKYYTNRGIHIGSTIAEIKSAYSIIHYNEESIVPTFEVFAEDQDSFVVYRILFYTESGKVKSVVINFIEEWEY